MSGPLIDEKLLKAALACIDKSFGNSMATLLVGGRAVGLARKNSDVDLMVLASGDDIPSLPFKFPTTAGTCEVEYHSAHRLGQRMAGYRNLLLEIGNQPSSYVDAKFLAETASRILTGHQVSGAFTRDDTSNLQDAQLQTVCKFWIAFKLKFVENVLVLREKFPREFHDVWTDYEFKSICFEHRCRLVQAYLLFFCNEYYISGRYKWLVKLAQRNGRNDLYDYLVREVNLGDGAESFSCEDDDIYRHLKTRLAEIISSDSFALCPTAGSRMIRRRSGEIVLASLDGRAAELGKEWSGLFENIDREELDEAQAGNIFLMLKKGMACLTPKLNFH